MAPIHVAAGSTERSGVLSWAGRIVGVWAVLSVAGLAGGASPVFAAPSPWWRVLSVARPSYLHAGVARDETQRLTVTASGGKFTLTDTEASTSASFASSVSAGELQVGLEGLYGSGNVRVSGGPGGAGGGQPFEVVFVGALADRAVRVMEVASGELTLGAGAGSAAVAESVLGRADGEIVVNAENIGDATTVGELSVADVLPAGIHAVNIAGFPGQLFGLPFLSCVLQTLTCTSMFPVPPTEQLEVRIAVVVDPGAASGGLNTASVSGGGGPSKSVSRPVTVSSQPTPFGVQDYELTNEEEGGAPTTQAGAHPFQQTTTIVLNQTADAASFVFGKKPEVRPAAGTKDLSFNWPPGLIGNPSIIPRCTTGQFLARINGGVANLCAADTTVGVATVEIYDPVTVQYQVLTYPLQNLEPQPGEPARFGFNVEVGDAPVFIDTAVRSGGDYGVTVKVGNITQTVGFLSSTVTVWGVPGDSRHSFERGTGCLREARGEEHPTEPCQPVNAVHPPPFLSLPTSCTGPLFTDVQGDPWNEPTDTISVPSNEAMPALDGCNRLPFSPSLALSPDASAASTPTGLAVHTHVSQEEASSGSGLAPADVKSIVVDLPEGVVVNPAGGDGLQACSESLVGFTGFAEYLAGVQTPTFTDKLPSPLLQGVNFCPDASKIATVSVKTPILPDAIVGNVYLATPAPNGEPGMNPFNSLIAMYLIAEDPVSGVLLKLPGKATLDPVTGRIRASFDDTPQAPFEDAELHFFGGDRAPLATPAHCGAYTARALFTPWSGNEPVGLSSPPFVISSGPNGGPCPGALLPFSASLTAGTTNINAGAFSPLRTTISRPDGNQDIQTVQLHMPPGLSGILKGVKLCGEAQANAGSCGADSLIGHTIVSVGLGGDPFSVTGGQVFLTESYKGSSYGLSIVNPAKAGPFDLGKVIVRAKVDVDPHTAQLTVTTDAIPHILDGIPLQIKHVSVTIDRPGFTFNPTNCNPLAITGTIASAEGALSPVGVVFRVTNCASLKFAPKFAVSTSAKTSRAKGASLTARLSYPNAPQGTQTNIARVKVDLPKQLPSRLTTLQKACTNAQFEKNPAGCPTASKIGHATVTTPLLPVPLTGPAIFVSHGGEAFPSLTMVLQGYGVTIDLIGTTFISKKGITSTTFKTVPDVPFNTFTLTLPEGKYSALAANGNLCKAAKQLAMPTAFTAQNGQTIHQTTKIGVTGCHTHHRRARHKRRK